MKMKTWFAAVLVGAIITGTVIAFAGNGVNLLTQARPEVVQRATMPGISCAVVTATDGIIRFRIVAWKIEALKSDAIKECYGRAVNSTPGPNDQDSIWAPISSYFEGVRCYKNRKLVAIEFGDPRANEESRIKTCFKEAEREAKEKEEERQKEEKEHLPSA